MASSKADGTPPGSGWHLDKRVPLAMIFAIIVQTIGLVVFVARLETRVAHLEANDARTTSLDLSGRIIRVETQLAGLNETTVRIERKVDSLIDRVPR
ncbi:MAG: hypothetical protein GY798_34835 [Hyphomicrobiales bacterium]|nr:hypothetical protein [Hyphomicrobiales bacterium]